MRHGKRWGIGGFRPRLVPSLITFPMVLLCLGLGSWQIQRLHWKEGLIAERDAALAAPPVAPPRTIDEARAREFHRVVAEGIFLHDREILRIAPGPTGESGFDVLTPLRLADGRALFVNRGFVPTDRQDAATRAAGQLAGTVRVAGLLRLPPVAKPSFFTPENRPDRHFWFWLDLPAMAAADRLPDAAPFYIEADATPNPGGWPKGGEGVTPLPNDHLQYAITWFSLAVAGLVIYVLSQRGNGGADGGHSDRIPGA